MYDALLVGLFINIMADTAGRLGDFTQPSDVGVFGRTVCSWGNVRLFARRRAQGRNKLFVVVVIVEKMKTSTEKTDKWKSIQ
jgi:hypothetical protein